MTYAQKLNFVARFMRWLKEKKHCRMTAEADAESGLTVYEVTETDPTGRPANTICFDIIDDSKPGKDGWIELFERKCEKKLLFDSFAVFGLGEVSSFEELELKFEIMT